MAILPADQRELYLPLMSELAVDPPWPRLLPNLISRTGARRACLVLRGPSPDGETVMLRADAARARGDPALDLAALAALGLFPAAMMRSGRIYTLDELLDFDNPARLAAQRHALAAMRINHARAVRIGTPGESEGWLLLIREREDLGAADSALLAALAPHMTAALGVRAALAEARARAAIAESTLAQLGLAEIAFNAGGQVLAADPLAERLLPMTAEPGALRRLQLVAQAARALEAACTALAGAPPQARRLVRLGDRPLREILLRPAALALTAPGPSPAVIGVVRTPHAALSAQAPGILAQAHGLSPREAELAIGLASGETILEAGVRLGLTPETARNYSKRVYAKTGTSGQAQLVAHVLNGLAPLA